MGGERQDDLERLDGALLRLRRYFEAPATLDDDGSPVDLSTLLVLDALTTAGGPATVRDIARRLGIAHSTASRFVTRAERVGLVARGPSERDRRATLVEATGAGRALAARAAQFRIRRLVEATGDWDPADTATLAELLDRFATCSGARVPAPGDVEAP